MSRIFLVFTLLFVAGSSLLAQRTGKDYAIFFYVTDFQPGWPKLPETATEAKLLKTELETSFGFTCDALANPTKAQILSKLRTYNERLTSNDQVMFFFSMHGHFEAAGAGRGYLVAADGLETDLYGDTYLSYDDLSATLALCKAKHVLLALDACHSGAFGIRNKAKPEEPTFSQSEDCAHRITRMLQYTGRQYCSSGNKESKTPAKSLFASRFLEALRKGGDDGIVRFDDLEYYLGKVESPKPESGTFTGHEPGGDFVFVRKGSCFSSLIKDRDADGVSDDDDKCPDNFGMKSNSGCPESLNTNSDSDSDYDGVPNKEDKCPDKYGIKSNAGCPDISIGNSLADKDRDGILDNQDGCPDDYGTSKANGCPDIDNDGIPDKDDRCPTETGLAKANGCPDRDMDGVPDKSDKCVDKVGEIRWQGCPDSDGDGVPDHEDLCPNVKGLVAESGCPPPDRDHDGVPDKSDMCKDKPGEARWQGCPDSDGDGLPDHEDSCPTKKGLAIDKGCPPPDRDNDGVPDEVDKCPDKSGEPNLEGCPAITQTSTRIDSLNYAHGMVAADMAKRLLGSDLNYDLFLVAMNEVLEGRPTMLSFEDATAIEKAVPSNMWKSKNTKFLDENKKLKNVITTASGLQYEVLKRGNGNVSPKPTDKVEVHYHGTLIDGTVFDSSVERGKTATFPLNGVISGWTEGLQYMKEGDKFKFFIPSNLAYGERGAGAKIKAYSTLIFEVELIKVNPQ